MSRVRSPLQPILRQWLWLIALLSVGVGAAIWNDWLWRADLSIYDAGLASGSAPADILIVAIDDNSLEKIGRWPWRRAIHAALLDRLRAAQVRVVALDLVFSEPDSIPSDDVLLAKAIAAGPPTVLPLIVDWQHGATLLREIPPIAPLAAVAASLAHVNLEIDRDGIARSVFLREGLGHPSRSHLALALLEAVPELTPASLPGERWPSRVVADNVWVRDYHLHIPFLGATEPIRRVSYVDVLKGAIPVTELRNKLVLIGATAQGLGDAYPTPKSGESVLMPGVEITANVLSALRTHHAIQRVPRGWAIVLALIPLCAAFAGFLRFSPRGALLFIVGLSAATVAVSILALRYSHVWWPPTAALCALVLAYPLWSWRRLEATQHYLDMEFAELTRESKPLPPASLRRPILQLVDVLQSRIDRVRDAAARLRHLRKILGDTIAALPDAILLVDTNGRIVLANPGAAALFGVAAATTLETEPVDPYLKSFGADLVPIYRTLAASAPCSIDVQQPSGRSLLLRVAAFHDGDGVRSGAVIDIADVSELKLAERERDDTIRFLSHDLRSPSSSLLGLASLLRDPLRVLPPTEVAQRIESLADRTLALADGFIALARAQIIEPSRFDDVDLRDVLQDAIDEVWAAAESKHVALVTRVDDVAIVHGDRQMLGRALANLINNAVKYSPPDSRVSSAIDKHDDCWIVSVRDDGPGIAIDRQEHLFKRFTRALHHGDSDPGGVGLGLAFVRVVAQKHGGVIYVDSDAGHGATFSFELPASKSS